jgi:hypothetical protein
MRRETFPGVNGIMAFEQKVARWCFDLESSPDVAIWCSLGTLVFRYLFPRASDLKSLAKCLNHRESE